MIDFHWKNEANRWRSEICIVRSYADSLLKSCKTVYVARIYALQSTHYIQETNRMLLTEKRGRTSNIENHKGETFALSVFTWTAS